MGNSIFPDQRCWPQVNRFEAVFLEFPCLVLPQLIRMSVTTRRTERCVLASILCGERNFLLSRIKYSAGCWVVGFSVAPLGKDQSFQYFAVSVRFLCNWRPFNSSENSLNITTVGAFVSFRFNSTRGWIGRWHSMALNLWTRRRLTKKKKDDDDRIKEYIASGAQGAVWSGFSDGVTGLVACPEFSTRRI